MGKQTEQETGA